METNSSHSPAPVKLNDEQIESYHENGFLGPFDLYSPEQMAKYRGHFQSLLTKQEQSQEYINKKRRAPETSAYSKEPITGQNLQLNDRAIYDLALHPKFTEPLAGLLGPDILLWRTQLWAKPPNARAIFWHQDTYKKMGASYGEMHNISIWLAIDDTTEENGCVELIPGSHKNGIIDPKTLRPPEIREKIFQSSHLILPEIFSGQTPEKMTLKSGQFFIFDHLCFHGSAPNLSGKNRIGMAFRYIATSSNFSLDSPCILARGQDRYGHHKLAPPVE